MDAQLVTAIGGFLSVILAVGAFVMSNRKLSAEGTQIITTSALQMVEALNVKVDGLQRHLEAQDREIALLRRGLSVLSNQIRRMGQEPEFELPDPFSDTEG